GFFFKNLVGFSSSGNLIKLRISQGFFVIQQCFIFQCVRCEKEEKRGAPSSLFISLVLSFSIICCSIQILLTAAFFSASMVALIFSVSASELILSAPYFNNTPGNLSRTLFELLA